MLEYPSTSLFNLLSKGLLNFIKNSSLSVYISQHLAASTSSISIINIIFYQYLSTFTIICFNFTSHQLIFINIRLSTLTSIAVQVYLAVSELSQHLPHSKSPFPSANFNINHFHYNLPFHQNLAVH